MDKITFVGFGDSLTYGYGVFDGISFMDRLSSALPKLYTDTKWAIINSGINGDTTREGVHRLNRDVIKYKPDILTVLFGSNDSALNDYQHISIAEFEINLNNIVKTVKEKTSAEIILITPPPLIEEEPFPFTTNKAVAAYSAVIKAVSENWSLRLIDFNNLMAEDAGEGLSDYLQYDGLHLSDKGYGLLYDLVLNEITDIVKGGSL